MTTPHKDWHVYKTYEEAFEASLKNKGWILHILQNDDKTFSIMRHINCEWCDYCTQRNVAYDAGLRYSENYPLVHKAKDDPYEIEGRDE